MNKNIAKTEAIDIKPGDICMVLDPVEVLGSLVLVYQAKEHDLYAREESPYIPDREDLLRRAGRQMIKGFSISRHEPILSNDVQFEPDETGLPGTVTVHSSIWTNLLYSGQVSKIGELNPETKDQIIRELIDKSNEFGHTIIDEEEADERIAEICRVSNRSRWPVREIQSGLDPIYRRNMAESTAENGDICRIKDPETGEEHLVWVIDEDKDEGPVTHFFMAELAGDDIDENSFAIKDVDGQAYRIFPEAYGLCYGFNLKPVTKTNATVDELTETYTPGVEIGIPTDKSSKMCEVAKNIQHPVWGND